MLSVQSAFSGTGDVPCDDFTAKNGNASIIAEFCAKVGYFYLLPTTDLPMRILLVEDEVKTLQSLRQGMEEQGWNVNTATDGQTGLRLAMSGDYDVIISDITMPELTGIQFLRELRRSGISTPFMLLTALSDTNDKIGGLDAGADDYLAKPFDFRELLARVKALARRPSGITRKENVLRYADVEMDLGAKKGSSQRERNTPDPERIRTARILYEESGNRAFKIGNCRESLGCQL